MYCTIPKRLSVAASMHTHSPPGPRSLFLRIGTTASVPATLKRRTNSTDPGLVSSSQFPQYQKARVVSRRSGVACETPRAVQYFHNADQCGQMKESVELKNLHTTETFEVRRYSTHPLSLEGIGTDG
jgi:hypothetical protein